jgi:hypothetical protein
MQVTVRAISGQEFLQNLPRVTGKRAGCLPPRNEIVIAGVREVSAAVSCVRGDAKRGHDMQGHREACMGERAPHSFFTPMKAPRRDPQIPYVTVGRAPRTNVAVAETQPATSRLALFLEDLR